VSVNLVGLAGLLGLGLLVVFVASVWFTAHRLLTPPRRTRAWAVSRGVAGDPGELDEPRSFKTEVVVVAGREVELWEIEGDAAGGPAVIVTPGWGDSKVGALRRLDALAGWASRVIAWDPPGLGVSAGRCGMGVTEPGMILELIDRYAGAGAGGGGGGVALYGWSLGGGASVVAGAGDARVVGVIAEAPYRVAATPARNVLAGAGLPWRVNLPCALWLIGLRLGVGPRWRGFDRSAHAAGLGAPLLVVHGTEDAVCPIGDGREIAGAAGRGEVAEIQGAGHNDLWSDPSHRAACERAVRAFGESVTGSPASSL